MLLTHLLLFLIGCIGTRLSLAYIAKIIPIQYLPYMGAIALIPAIGFFTIWFFQLREYGVEVPNHEKIWWNHLRPVHGTFYLAFAISALVKYPNAWAFLLSDALLGLTSFLHHYYF
jgi:hypothetical protein